MYSIAHKIPFGAIYAYTSTTEPHAQANCGIPLLLKWVNIWGGLFTIFITLLPPQKKIIAVSIIADFVSLFFPCHCFSCAGTLTSGEDTICTHCIVDLPKTNYYGEETPITKRMDGRLPLAYGLAFLKFRKGGNVQRLLHQLKYGNHPEIGVKLGKMYGKELYERGFAQQIDLIIPVPLHRSKLKKRGYNQSAKFAEGLSYALHVPWSGSAFIRKARTPTQTSKSASERWENVKDAFHIADADRIHQKRILLVDDIITTGATLEACGIHLVQGQCAKLSIICIAEAC